MSDLMRELSEAIRPHDGRSPVPLNPDIAAEKLRGSLAAFRRPNDFAIGDVVRIKSGLRHSGITRTCPAGLFIVVYVGATPLDPLDGDLDRYIKTDLVVAYYDDDEDFMFTGIDRRLMEPVPEEDLWPRKS